MTRVNETSGKKKLHESLFFTIKGDQTSRGMFIWPWPHSSSTWGQVRTNQKLGNHWSILNFHKLSNKCCFIFFRQNYSPPEVTACMSLCRFLCWDDVFVQSLGPWWRLVDFGTVHNEKTTICHVPRRLLVKSFSQKYVFYSKRWWNSKWYVHFTLTSLVLKLRSSEDESETRKPLVDFEFS